MGRADLPSEVFPWQEKRDPAGRLPVQVTAETGGVYGGGIPGSITFFDDPSVIVNNTNGKYPLGFQTPGIVRQLAITSQTIGDFSSRPMSFPR